MPTADEVQQQRIESGQLIQCDGMPDGWYEINPDWQPPSLDQTVSGRPLQRISAANLSFLEERRHRIEWWRDKELALIYINHCRGLEGMEPVT